MIISSGGGIVTAGLAIYDMMQYVRAPVHTMCIGHASSMAAILLAAGEKGHRTSTPHGKRRTDSRLHISRCQSRLLLCLWTSLQC